MVGWFVWASSSSGCRLWKPDLASFHWTWSPVELKLELRTARRKNASLLSKHAATSPCFILGCNQSTFQHGLALISSAFLHLHFFYFIFILAWTLPTFFPFKIRVFFGRFDFRGGVMASYSLLFWQRLYCSCRGARPTPPESSPSTLELKEAATQLQLLTPPHHPPPPS